MTEFLWVYTDGKAYLSKVGPDDRHVCSILEKDCAIYSVVDFQRYILIGHFREVKLELIPLAFPKIGQKVLLRNKNLPARIICTNRKPNPGAPTKTIVILYTQPGTGIEASMSVGPEDLVEVGVKYKFVPVTPA